jgi:hypothetical protein
MPVSFQEILLAYDFDGGGAQGLHRATLCRQRGKIYSHSEFSDLEEFESKATERDLREWCEFDSIELAG